jgi:hypothetical protein
MTKKDGGPAFPQCSYNLKGGYDITGGKTLRDDFAMAALQGLLSAVTAQACVDAVCENAKANGITLKAQFAKAAYEYADAMLAERSK